MDRRHQLCKCYKCGIISKCTPEFDFYTVEDYKTDDLYCERCFETIIGLKLINLNKTEVVGEDGSNN